MWRCSSPLSARTPTQAVQAFLRDVRLALSCITQGVVSIDGRGGYDPAGQPHTATLNRRASTRLDHADFLALRTTIEYSIVMGDADAPWLTQTAGYIYSFRGRDDVEFLAYHWHPQGGSRVTWPHLHLQSPSSSPVTGRTHLPTGIVHPEDIVRLAIEEFAVRPRRPNWDVVLRRIKQDRD
jgi:hypothetical protein